MQVYANARPPPLFLFFCGCCLRTFFLDKVVFRCRLTVVCPFPPYKVYISWANSLLCEANRSVDNVAAVQDGKILCELIDILAPDAGLVAKIQVSLFISLCVCVCVCVCECVRAYAF